MWRKRDALAKLLWKIVRTPAGIQSQLVTLARNIHCAHAKNIIYSSINGMRNATHPHILHPTYRRISGESCALMWARVAVKIMSQVQGNCVENWFSEIIALAVNAIFVWCLSNPACPKCIACNTWNDSCQFGFSHTRNLCIIDETESTHENREQHKIVQKEMEFNTNLGGIWSIWFCLLCTIVCTKTIASHEPTSYGAHFHQFRLIRAVE